MRDLVYRDISKVHMAVCIPALLGQRGLRVEERGTLMLNIETVSPNYSKDSIASATTRTRYSRPTPICELLDGLLGLLPGRSRQQRLAESRRRLWSLVPSGRLLEVGVGTGTNIPYYPTGAEVTAIDLCDKVLAQAHRRAAQEGAKVVLYEMDVQALSFEEDSFDTAVASWVFCSVADPVRGLRELSRVVQPKGHIVLLDHVRVDWPIIGRMMDLLNPVAVRTIGANINRRTAENVRRAGLIIEREEDLAPMGAVKLIVARPGPRVIFRE